VSLIGAGALSSMALLAAADKRHQDEEYSDNEDLFLPAPLASWDWNAIQEAMGFVSPWWPSSGNLMGGGLSGDADSGIIARAAMHADMWRSFGANGRLAFVGYTRDSAGQPIGGCTVRAFRTATDEMVARVVSDANGYYAATSPYLEAHYLTVHKTSTPDVAGASVDTLTPA
jgi:hypothetical protein